MAPRAGRQIEGPPEQPLLKGNPVIRTTVEALGGAQAVASELIPARKLHQHLINQVATGAGNVLLADTAGTSAAVVMSIQHYQQLLDELNTLRRNNSNKNR